MAQRYRRGGQGPAIPELETFELGGTREDLVAEVLVTGRGRAQDTVGVCFSLYAPSLKKSVTILNAERQRFAVYTDFDGKGRGQLPQINSKTYPPDVWTVIRAKTFEGKWERSATIPAPSGKARPTQYVKCLQGTELVYRTLKGPMHLQTFTAPNKPGKRKIAIFSDKRFSLDINPIAGEPIQEKNLTRWSGETDDNGLLITNVSFFSSPTKLRIVDLDSGESIEITLTNREVR